jgi:ArsR family transcriptional regulator
MNIVFKALNDQTRRKILDLLKEKDMSAGEIADQFRFFTCDNISHHLELLQHADLVSSIKKGQFIIYSINTTVLNEISKWIVELIDNQNGDKKLS